MNSLLRCSLLLCSPGVSGGSISCHPSLLSRRIFVSLTAEQKQLVQASFPKVALNAEAVAAAFYARLFADDPSVQPLFKGDMQQQGVKLMQMIATAVASLDRLDDIVPAVQALGQRHVNYGVQKEHYALVGGALLATLQDKLGDEFTPELKDAWTQVYTVLANTATAAAYPEAV
jgi:hemoglobin-like flavoprotein